MDKKSVRKKKKPKVIIETTKAILFVSVPPEVHVALEAEADEEGVTLNELMIAKLAMGLSKKQSS